MYILLLIMNALNLFLRDEYMSQWLERVKYILDSCGLSYMWYHQQELSTKQCKVIIHQRIEDINSKQKCNTDISTSFMDRLLDAMKSLRHIFESHNISQDINIRMFNAYAASIFL